MKGVRSMAELSKATLNLVSKFLTTEVESRAAEGITWQLLLKGRHDDRIAEYKALRETITAEGFGPNDIFRMYELSNGYIFDMDLGLATKMTIKLANAMASRMNIPSGETFGARMCEDAEKRRQEDLEKMAKRVLTHAKNREATFEMALFSKNSIPKIVINGKNSKGEAVTASYDAYAVRHWDIEEINVKYLVPKGVRIVKIEPCEVIPTMTGVRFIVHIANV